MKSKLLKYSVVFLTGMVIAFFYVTSAAYADVLKIKPIQKSIVPPNVKPANLLPDLIVKTSAWSSHPKAGDAVGMSCSMNITVLNQGSGAAGASLLKTSCQSLSGAACPDSLDGTINVQPLGPGQSVTIAWPPGDPSEKWSPGKYTLTFSANVSNQIQESNETNNSSQLILTILPELNIQQSSQDVTKIQRATSPAASATLSIPVQSPLAESTHDVGKSLPVRWSKTLISNYATVDIYLLGGYDGKLFETIKKGAVNSGEYNAWIALPKYAGPGSAYKIQIITPDQKISGHSEVFSIQIPPKKKMPFMVDAAIINGWAYKRGGDLSPTDCLSAPQIQAGRPPGSQEVKIGHFVKSGKHGECRYSDAYYFRSRIFFDMSYYQGKEIVEASLMIRLGDTINLIPDGTLATNEGTSSQCDIYLLTESWPASPQPLYNFYPGTFLKSFNLFAQGETAKVDLLGQVRDWASGKANQGLMLRDPLNGAKYVNSACVKYYHSIKLVGWYLE